jgi:hypothetical protein
MAELFASGRMIDVILFLVLLEVIALALLRRIIPRTPRFAALAPNLAAGFFLLIALRAAIANARWELIALPLTLALVAHSIDLAWRWRECPDPGKIAKPQKKQP